MNTDITIANIVITVPLRSVMNLNKDNTKECIKYIADEYKAIFFVLPSVYFF